MNCSGPTRPTAKHPEFGFYELEKILATFRKQGFVVSGEIKPKSAPRNESADRVVLQIQELLEAGVPLHHVTVIGASMAVVTALLVSERLGQTDMQFAVLGTCLTQVLTIGFLNSPVPE